MGWGYHETGFFGWLVVFLFVGFFVMFVGWLFFWVLVCACFWPHSPAVPSAVLSLPTLLASPCWAAPRSGMTGCSKFCSNLVSPGTGRDFLALGPYTALFCRAGFLWPSGLLVGTTRGVTGAFWDPAVHQPGSRLWHHLSYVDFSSG